MDWATTELEPNHVVGVWAELTHLKLDLACRLWAAGLPPLVLEWLTALSENGITPADLARKIQGKPLREHINPNQYRPPPNGLVRAS